MKKVTVALVLVLLVLGAVTLHFEWREQYLCNACLTRKTVSSWRLGAAPLGYPVLGGTRFTDRTLLISKPHESFEESVARQLFPEQHRHEWVFSQASPYYLFGTRWAGCALGARRQLNPFAYAFLNNPEFRDHVQKLIKSGDIPQSEAAALFAFEPGQNASTDPRFARGVRLVREFQAANRNPKFDETFERVVGRA